MIPTPPPSPNPSTEEAISFFAKYRRDVRTLGQNEASARRASAAEQNALLTQAQQNSVTTMPKKPPQDQEIHSYVPVDQTKNTRSFRLNMLKKSPKNFSPSLLGVPKYFLPAAPLSRKRVTLVLDVDETLVHSSFTKRDGVTYDTILKVLHDGKQYELYVLHRPYLMEFLDFVARRFEVVIFTASLSSYCDPLMDILDPDNLLGPHRLFREHCTPRNGSYIKDLCDLNRDLSRIAIIDNSPTAYLFQQRNAIPITSWFEDKNDTELLKLFPLLEKLSRCTSVYDILDEYNAGK